MGGWRRHGCTDRRGSQLGGGGVVGGERGKGEPGETRSDKSRGAQKGETQGIGFWVRPLSTGTREKE